MESTNKIRFIGFMVGLSLMGTYFLITKILFLSKAEHVSAVVTQVGSINSSYGPRERSLRFPFELNCTRYRARVEGINKYGIPMKFAISAGREPKHDQPIEKADLKSGDYVEIVYDPNNEKIYHQYTFIDEWGGIILSYVIALWISRLALGWRFRKNDDDEEVA